MKIPLSIKKKRINQTVSIKGEEVEVIGEYKYLGVHLDKLNWRLNSETVNKKGRSRLYFLRNLWSFKVYSKILQIFNTSVVGSVISSTFIC